MPSLSDQLKELGVEVGASNIQLPSRSSTRQMLIDVFEGSWEETKSGECFVVRKSFPPRKRHGKRQLYRKLDLSVFSLAPEFNGISDISPENILYVDTETTGLSGGAGTYVFLVGAAKIIENCFVLAQFFLQDPSSEASQLMALENFSAGIDLVVSYNGKSFDLPRIRSRYAFHGWQSPFKDVMHIDLLHLARRLWKNHLPGCTLGDLEHHILDINRSTLDIPGWQVSEKFFEYLQTGDPDPLKNVFYHNEVDVLSLISLLSYISDRLSKPTSPKYSNKQDLVSIGSYLAQYNDKLAIQVLSKSLENPDLSNKNKISGMYNLANLYKRYGQYDLAVPLWKSCAEHKDHRSFIELAKYYEHKKNDFEEAIHWTLSALEIYHLEELATHETLIAEAEYRLNRLIKKKRSS